MTPILTHYAVFFSGTIAGKLFTEWTNGFDTASEAIDKARELYQEDGYTLRGLYALDVFGDDPAQRIHTGAQLKLLFDNEERARDLAEAEDEREAYEEMTPTQQRAYDSWMRADEKHDEMERV